MVFLMVFAVLLLVSVIAYRFGVERGDQENPNELLQLVRVEVEAMRAINRIDELHLQARRELRRETS
jgi:hypothetical protein